MSDIVQKRPPLYTIYSNIVCVFLQKIPLIKQIFHRKIGEKELRILVVIVRRKSSRFGAERLFGSVFPKLDYICAEDFAVINDPRAVVIVEDCAEEADVKSALCVIADGDGGFCTFPDGIRLVTCGVNPKNTVSFTSRSENSITLSLNRAIRTENGVTEPFEYPAKLLRGFSEYDYMAAFAASLFQ